MLIQPAIISPFSHISLLTPSLLFCRPDYRETVFYGRKWINRLVLQLASIKEIAEAPPDADPKSNRFTQGQKQVVELTEGLLMSFVQKEEAASQYRHSELEELVYKRYTALVQELFAGYGSMDDIFLRKMSWISPVLLSSCIRSKNEEIRLMVQKLVSRASGDSTPAAPYPSPTAPKPAEAKEGKASAALTAAATPPAQTEGGEEGNVVEPAVSTAPTSASVPADAGVEPVQVDDENGPQSGKADHPLPNGSAAEATAAS